MKLYMMVLYAAISPVMRFRSWIQHGAGKGFQCLEVVHALRLVSEKCLEWGMPLILISLDVRKAYDSLKLGAVIAIFEKYRVPLRLRYAVLRELLATKVVSFYFLGLAVWECWCQQGLSTRESGGVIYIQSHHLRCLCHS